MSNLPIAAQLAAAILGTGLMAGDQAHVAQLEEEAALLTQASRELEDRKMQQTTHALDPKYASAEREAGRAVKIAAAIAAAQDDQEKLAYLLERQGMDKEAIGALIGGLARGAGAALKGMGGAASAAGRLGGRQLSQGPGMLQRAGGWLSGKGHGLVAAGTPAAAPLKATQGVLSAAPAAAKAAPAAAAATQAAPAVAQAAPAATRGKPLLSMATKGKLLAGGALAGAGYVGMKGMQAARDYMMMPSGHQGAPVMHDVNQYGYPQH